MATSQGLLKRTARRAPLVILSLGLAIAAVLGLAPGGIVVGETQRGPAMATWRPTSAAASEQDLMSALRAVDEWTRTLAARDWSAHYQLWSSRWKRFIPEEEAIRSWSSWDDPNAQIPQIERIYGVRFRTQDIIEVQLAFAGIAKPIGWLVSREEGQWRIVTELLSPLPAWAVEEQDAQERGAVEAAERFVRVWTRRDFDALAEVSSLPSDVPAAAGDAEAWVTAKERLFHPLTLIYVTLPEPVEAPKDDTSEATKDTRQETKLADQEGSAAPAATVFACTRSEFTTPDGPKLLSPHLVRLTLHRSAGKGCMGWRVILE